MKFKVNITELKHHTPLNNESLRDYPDFIELEGEAILEEEQASNDWETPMGVSQWMNHGKKFGYFKFFFDKFLKS